MIRSTWRAAALAVAGLAGAAAAQVPVDDPAAPSDAAAPPPPPASLDDAGVKAWMERYIETDGWAVLAADQGAVAMGSPEGVAVLADKTLKAEIREEYFKPVKVGPMDARSNLQVWNVDCQGPRMRVLAIRIFPGNNLQGEFAERKNLQAAWTPLAPGSVPARTVERICGVAVASRSQGAATPR